MGVVRKCAGNRSGIDFVRRKGQSGSLSLDDLQTEGVSSAHWSITLSIGRGMTACFVTACSMTACSMTACSDERGGGKR